MFKRSLNSRCVLPITYEGRLTPNAEYCKTIVSKVRIAESCCDFEEKTVAFKVFQHYHEDIDAYESEVNVFEKLPRNSSDVIIRCLGSFTQNEKCVVVLEHAPGGSLKDFLAKTRRPKSRQELLQLWNNFIGVLNALQHLHNLAPGSSETIGCAHRDIKLDNMLVFPKSEDPGNEYDFSLKLTDFDTSTNVQIISSKCSGRQNHDGGRTYCAPEASRVQERIEYDMLNVSVTSDVWSLGAVFSEIIVWLAEGIGGIETYETRRKQETSLLPNFRGSGFEACFHDGTNRLKCVDEVHNETRGLLLSLDNITPLIRRLTESYMLVPTNIRLDAMTLFHLFVNEITRLPPMPPAQLQTDVAPAPERPITISDLDRGAFSAGPIMVSTDDNFPDQSHVTQNSNNAAATQSSKSRDSQEAPVSQCQETTVAANRDPKLPQISVIAVNSWVDARMKTKITGMDEVLLELEGREQLFVIDDSLSMRRHKDYLCHTSRALIAIASKVDPNRVEMVFTSNLSRFMKGRHRIFGFLSGAGQNHMVDKIRSHFEKPSTVSTNMESKIGQILTHVERTKKRTSIYIMTDGVWQPSASPGGGVEEPIRTLVRRMFKDSRNREFVTLQFIQFGNDLIGTERLRYLDDDLPKLEGMHDYDIVDTRRHDDNVPHMLIGAISRHYDRQEAHINPAESPAGPSRETTDRTHVLRKSRALPRSLMSP
ncbi:serine threonine kinase [Apiospora arundinis]|uniref:Serine threonine kinase n=1 Tax=Apiospora arundinis TaxID=335852 RepID=A0ABR2I7P2_9PEZI